MMNKSGTMGRDIGKHLWSFVKQNYLKILCGNIGNLRLTVRPDIFFFLSSLQICV